MILSPAVYVAETFLSLQGEGVLVGMPSFFIRASGCPLRCRWCDTEYASWSPEGSIRSVDELVGSAVASGAGHVVLTGGEPLVQRDVSDLTRAIRRAGLHLTIETAGVIEPDAGLECDLLSVSPKTSSSDPEGSWRDRHRRRRSDLGPLTNLLARFPEHQIKLVIQQRSDIDDVLALLDELETALGRVLGAPSHGLGLRAGQGGSRVISPHRVLLMPEGRDAAEVEQRAPMVAALCLEHGFRYTPRLHLDLFGGGRGV